MPSTPGHATSVCPTPRSATASARRRRSSAWHRRLGPEGELLWLPIWHNFPAAYGRCHGWPLLFAKPATRFNLFPGRGPKHSFDLGPALDLHRRRWLLGLLVLQSSSSFILDKYEPLIREHLFITLFLTMLVGAGGNAGNQSAIKVIRGLVRT